MVYVIKLRNAVKRMELSQGRERERDSEIDRPGVSKVNSCESRQVGLGLAFSLSLGTCWWDRTNLLMF